MLILNQLGNKLVNLDNVEAVEIDYRTGSTYSVVAVTESQWDNVMPNQRATIKMGEYMTSLQCEAVIQSISQLMMSDAKLTVCQRVVSMSRSNEVCRDSRPCFARTERGFRTILTSTYEKDGECPFCKRFRSRKADGSKYKCKMKGWSDEF